MISKEMMVACKCSFRLRERKSFGYCLLFVIVSWIVLYALSLLLAIFRRSLYAKSLTRFWTFMLLTTLNKYWDPFRLFHSERYDVFLLEIGPESILTLLSSLIYFQDFSFILDSWLLKELFIGPNEIIYFRVCSAKI